jgi:hypothetical protein
MTKEEVIQVMGTPDSMGADGRYEYMNYRLTNRSGYGYGITMMQQYIVRLANGRVISYGVGDQSYNKPTTNSAPATPTKP